MSSKKKVLVRTGTDPLPEEARQYVTLKDTHKELGGRIKDLRDRLIDRVSSTGTEIEGGHQLLSLPDDIVAATGIKAFKREKRVSQSFREDELMAMLKDKGLYKDVTKTVRVLDEDALSAAVFEGKISEAELNSVVDQKVSWALTMEKK